MRARAPSAPAGDRPRRPIPALPLRAPRLLRPLAVGIAALVLAAPAAAQTVREATTLRRIEVAAARLEAGQRIEFERVQADFMQVRHLDGPAGRRLEEVLCRLAGATWRTRDGAEARALATTALANLQARLVGREADTVRRHVTDHAVRTASASPATRVGAVVALGRAERADREAGRDGESTVLVLFTAVRDPSPLVREAALEALVGHPSPRATQILGEDLATALEQPLASDALARAVQERSIDAAVLRLRRHVLARGPHLVSMPQAVADRLRDPVIRAWTAPEWRIASRALDLAWVLPAGVVAEPLVEALEVWTQRGIDLGRGIPTGIDRVRREIVAVLESRFGRSLGLAPERWRQWLAGLGEAGVGGSVVGADTTVATFFGLELRSSAVMFLLDTSGSMSSALEGYAPVTGRDTGPSRYDRAVEQLLTVLARPDDPIWFDVVLFDSDVRRLPRGPRQSTPSELQALRAWLRSRPPGGGTDLQKGLDALWPKSSKAPFFDTVVVLCDGVTNVTSEDAIAYLDGGPLSAGIVFHSIQIGNDAATSLAELASASGGQFLRISGP